MDKTSIIAHEVEEDRISNLPDDIIRLILSFLDLKDVVQFCTLSRNWKDVWTSMAHLNLNENLFPFESQFVRFVDHALCHRNNEIDVTSLELTFNGPITHPVVKKIVNYAYLHNVEKLTIWSFSLNFCVFPNDDLYNCRTLKHLTLAAKDVSIHRFPDAACDFPALETISLSNMFLYDHGDNFFSKCVKLKALTLHKCGMLSKAVFNIRAPRLSNLTITDSLLFPKVLNVVSPQLKNLTATVRANRYGFLRLYDSLRLTTDGFDSLDNVNLFMSNPKDKKEIYVPVLLSLFKKLFNARFLVLNMDIVETLSSCLDQVSHEPCPFNNLKCLKIVNVSPYQKDRIAEIVPQVRKYLLGNSPSATFIMDLRGTTNEITGRNI